MRLRPWDRPIFGPFRRVGRTGVPADHFRPMGPYGDGRRTLVANGPEFAAVGVHHTGTSGSAWDGPGNEAKLPSGEDASEGKLKPAFAWQDGDGDNATKAAYKFIHHFVSADGDIGDASTTACSTTVGILNGGRGTDVKSADWFGDRSGIYSHAIAHLKDSGVKDEDLPELDEMAVVNRRFACWQALRSVAPFDVSSSAESLIVSIDAAVDELMEELGIGDEDDDSDEDMAAAGRRILSSVMARIAAESMDSSVLSAEQLRQREGLDPADPLAVHPAFTGRHSHAHSAMGAQGEDDEHEHSHSHSGDAKHDHAHGTALEPRERLRQSHLRSIGLDPEKQVTDEEQLRSMVASAYAERGGQQKLLELRVRDGLTAATRPDGSIEPAEWHSYLCVEGIRTDDGRELMPNSCRFPDLPVSLRLLIADEGGHWGAVTGGRIDSMDRQAYFATAFQAIYSEGLFGSDENGQLCELMVREQTQRFVSIDPRDAEAEIIRVEISHGDIYDYLDDDMDGMCEEWLRITSCVIGGATVLSMPALPQAVITLKEVELPFSEIATASAPPGLPAPGEDAGSLAASAAGAGAAEDLRVLGTDGDGIPIVIVGPRPALAEVRQLTRPSITASGGPLRPPREWFDNPRFRVGDSRLVLQADGESYACPLTVTEEGQIFGHVAWWECDHTGFPGESVKPPHSMSSYADFLTGPGIECADGSIVRNVGRVTMGCGHAERGLGWKETVAHYDGGYGAVQMSVVKAGEDEFGPWVAGAVMPLRSESNPQGPTPEQVALFRTLSLSGDWREIEGNLELVAVLAVPVAGFPIRRDLAASAAVVELAGVRAGLARDDGHVISLVAAGRVVRLTPEQRLTRLEREFAQQQRTLASLRRREALSITSRIGA